jgi:hypothetical protein
MTVDSTYSGSIYLTDINGIYDYHPVMIMTYPPTINFFEKAGTSNLFIVRMPENRVTQPGGPGHFVPGDTLAANDFIVNVSDYQYRYTPFQGYDYKNTSNFNVKGVDAGTIDIANKVNFRKDVNYLSTYTFTNGYITKCQSISGDTTVSDYAITKDGQTYFEEKFVGIRSDSMHFYQEKQYSLTVGNVTIIRTGPLSTAQVYLDGVLQQNATVEIYDSTNDPGSVFKKRDLKITFDDGTTSTLSALAGQSITDIGSLFCGLRNAWVATNIIDRVAWDVYLQNHSTK